MTAPRTPIRRARLADAPALAALERRCFRTDRLSLRQWRNHLRGGRHLAWVAEVDGAVLGSALVFLHGEPPRARLYSIAVDRGARGQGLGARLLDACERGARAAGAVRMRLEVRRGNRAARGLYASRGYTETGLKPGFYEDGADAVTYVRELGRRRPARTSGAQ